MLAGRRDAPMMVLFLLLLAGSCSLAAEGPAAPAGGFTVRPTPTGRITVPPAPTQPQGSTWDLWVGGPHLRGANIYQRRVYPELDGPEFMGPGPVGPPYTQEDLNRLAALGANYVNISHPGLFTESPPYALDPAIQDNLDALLAMVARADMYAVISFRTGPGRSEFTFMLEDVGDWFDESYLNDSVWQEPAAQEAWAAMWRTTAERYRSNPVVAGYDLMVEPNANEVWLEVWEPQDFYPRYAGTLYDWNQMFPRIVAAVRQVDGETPILVGAMGYSAVAWLPYLETTGDPYTVYTVHQYAPFEYTHQVPGFLSRLKLAYPGEMDVDWDGEVEPFDRAWLENLMSTVDRFVGEHGVPVAVNEYGLMRWQPGAAGYMRDQMELFEARGLNYALWSWDPSWTAFAEEVDAFNFRHGPDPDHHADVESSTLLEVIRGFWRRNSVRPSGS